jgi:hypothetical protein
VWALARQHYDTMRTFFQFLLVTIVAAILFTLVGCGQPPRAVTAADFQVLRSYGWDSTIGEPQATWNPERYQVLARSAGGFVLLEEGTGKQQYFASRAKHDTAFPVWINYYQFAFGPRDNVLPIADGRVVATNEGVSIVTLLTAISGKNIPDAPAPLTKYGYRPKMWGDKIVLASEDKIYVTDGYGKIDEFGPGFMPEPQRNGLGITWQQFPVLEKDYWSGVEGRRGDLYIRWKKGTTTTLPNAIEARWTSNGGVIATVLRADPLPGQPWWSVGTDVYYVADAKANPVLVAADARSPAPHPTLQVCAVVGKTGAINICSFDGNFRHQIASLGDNPTWSHDGRRLLTEEIIDGKAEAKYLRVLVFKPIDLSAKKQ